MRRRPKPSAHRWRRKQIVKPCTRQSTQLFDLPTSFHQFIISLIRLFMVARFNSIAIQLRKFDIFTYPFLGIITHNHRLRLFTKITLRKIWVDNNTTTGNVRIKNNLFSRTIVRQSLKRGIKFYPIIKVQAIAIVPFSSRYIFPGAPIRIQTIAVRIDLQKCRIWVKRHRFKAMFMRSLIRSNKIFILEALE